MHCSKPCGLAGIVDYSGTVRRCQSLTKTRGMKYLSSLPYFQFGSVFYATYTQCKEWYACAKGVLLPRWRETSKFDKTCLVSICFNHQFRPSCEFSLSISTIYCLPSYRDSSMVTGQSEQLVILSNLASYGKSAPIMKESSIQLQNCLNYHTVSNLDVKSRENTCK